jgi:hypothetical protein
MFSQYNDLRFSGQCDFGWVATKGGYVLLNPMECKSLIKQSDVEEAQISHFLPIKESEGAKAVILCTSCEQNTLLVLRNDTHQR